MQKPFALVSLVLALFGAGPAVAQENTQGQASSALSQGTVISPVLTIDSDRLFRDSAFGVRVAAEAEARLNELGTQNRKIEADLEAEERALTVQRPTLTPDAFRALADAFDKKVQDTRAVQAAKNRAISDDLDRERDVFLNAAAPVMQRLMRDSGAAVILEQRSVFVSATAIEITDDAIALLDATIGSGKQ